MDPKEEEERPQTNDGWGAPFGDLEVRAEILEVLNERGYDLSTPVQERVLREGRGRDLLVQARTGSGKTVAYGCLLLDDLEIGHRGHDIMILCPTRELAVQVEAELDDLCAGLDLYSAVIIGGESFDRQRRELQRGAALIVGTPGRMLDMIRRKEIDARSIRSVVLDEADRLLDMGFRDELDQILRCVPKRQRTILGSATIPGDVRWLAEKHTNDALYFEVDSADDAHSDIDHRVYTVPGTKRFEALCNILAYEQPDRAIVFGTTRAETAALHDRMVRAGYRAGHLSGVMPQRKRSQTMERFRDGHLRYLVATDVAARGIDVLEVSHVIHYRMSQDASTYVHRSGRTGRAGRQGLSILMVSPSEAVELKKLDSGLPMGFELREVPEASDFIDEGRDVPSELNDGLHDTIEWERTHAERMQPGARQALEAQAGGTTGAQKPPRVPRPGTKDSGGWSKQVVDLRGASAGGRQRKRKPPPKKRV